jgi:hypothetical protein
MGRANFIKPSQTALRLTCFVGSAVLLLTLPTTLEAQFIYTTNNGAITIMGYAGPGGAVEIPTAIDGLPVTSVGAYAFSQNTNLTSITIPGSVTNIGTYGFQRCYNLGQFRGSI